MRKKGRKCGKAAKSSELPLQAEPVIDWLELCIQQPKYVGYIKRCGCLSVCLFVCHASTRLNGGHDLCVLKGSMKPLKAL